MAAKSARKKSSVNRARGGPKAKAATARKGSSKQAGGRARKPSAKRPPARGTLRGISEIRRFFHMNRTPIYFFSATNFNLLNTDEWVRNFRFINSIDCFDGAHPNVFIPREMGDREFGSIEDIVNYLLEHKEVRDYIKARGPGGKATFLFFDDRTEELCKELGLEILFPRAALRREVDGKISATRLAERAGVKSVPNVLAKVDSYEELRRAAKGLGPDLVVQTAFGDSGHTTFFISSEADYRPHAEEIQREPEVKIMRRIKCRQAAMEACVTKAGTICGPLMTELVGFPELTPYKGGWCGNEVCSDAFTPQVRTKAKRMAMALGAELWKMGYRGYFEIDLLLDVDSGQVYLGEINPRITGASAMTNLAAFGHMDAPLFLFHLLEWLDVPFTLDVEGINRRWSDPANMDNWSQLIIKHVDDTVERVAAAPRSGVWRLTGSGTAEFVRLQTHRRTVENEFEGFFLRILRPGDWLYKGADLGILVTPGRLMDNEFQLNDRAKAWIHAIRGQYVASASGALAPPERIIRPAEVGSIKVM